MQDVSMCINFTIDTKGDSIRLTPGVITPGKPSVCY